MPGAARVEDKDIAFNIAVEGSENVFINSLAAHRLEDMWSPGPSVILKTASPNVFVNSLGLGRCEDLNTLSLPVITCSENVIVN